MKNGVWFLPRRKVTVENYPVGTRVPKPFLEAIETLVKQGYYLDVSDYLRDVIRRDLEKRGFKPTEE